MDFIWEQQLNKIKSFINSNKKYPSRYSKDKSEKSMGTWIKNQKTSKSNKFKDRGRLNEEKTEKLESLPNWEW